MAALAAILLPTSLTAQITFQRTYGGVLDDWVTSVQQTSDGGYIIAGMTRNSTAGWGDVYLIKTDVRGDTVWTRRFGGVSSDQGQSVQQTGDDGYIVTGQTCSFGAGDDDVYLIKTDSLGNVGVAEPRQPQAASLQLQAEPNPCRASAVLHLTTGPLDHSTTLLRIFDASGRLVWSEPVRTSSLILHTSSLPVGAYFLRLDAGTRHATTRLVVQR